MNYDVRKLVRLTRVERKRRTWFSRIAATAVWFDARVVRFACAATKALVSGAKSVKPRTSWSRISKSVWLDVELVLELKTGTETCERAVLMPNNDSLAYGTDWEKESGMFKTWSITLTVTLAYVNVFVTTVSLLQVQSERGPPIGGDEGDAHFWLSTCSLPSARVAHTTT